MPWHGLNSQPLTFSLELRELWNAFDPIGVLTDPDWPRDEYDDYRVPVLERLQQAPPALEDYLADILYRHIGLTKQNDDEVKQFAALLRDWHASRTAV